MAITADRYRRIAVELGLGLCLLVLAQVASAATRVTLQGGERALLSDEQQLFLEAMPRRGEGWLGFTDLNFLINTVLTLVLATVRGAVLAYHPRRRQTADTVEEIEAPKVFVTYAVIGALIGILVVKYGLVVGFVLFGIGGLIRFRTVMASPSMTGQVIYVTLIGLA